MVLAIKNQIQEQRIPVNKYQLIIQPGVGAITATAISGLEEELDAAELPDRTIRSGGRSKPVEFDVTQPMHHTSEVQLMEVWYGLCKLSLPGYLKTGILAQQNEASIPTKQWTMPNLWIKKRSHTDLELENDGEMSEITWTLQTDQLIIVP